MAIQMSEGFKLLSKEALDSRVSYKTIEEMVAMEDYQLYDGILATIKGDPDKKLYQWWSTNEVDTTLGKWRQFKTSSDDFKFPNATIIGSPTINNGQVSNFSAANYMRFPFIVNMQGRPFSIDIALTTGSNITNQQNIIDGIDHGIAFAIRDSKFVLVLGSQSGQWDISNGEKISAVTVTANTDYRVRISWDGSVYKFEYSTNGETYTEDTNMRVTSSLSLYPTQINIGVTSGLGGVFTGIINMNFCSLTISDKVVWTGMDDVGLATRMAVDMSNIDEAGKKVVEDLAKGKIPVYTKAEYEAIQDTIKPGTVFGISDDYEQTGLYHAEFRTPEDLDFKTNSGLSSNDAISILKLCGIPFEEPTTEAGRKEYADMYSGVYKIKYVCYDDYYYGEATISLRYRYKDANDGWDIGIRPTCPCSNMQLVASETGPRVYKDHDVVRSFWECFDGVEYYKESLKSTPYKYKEIYAPDPYTYNGITNEQLSKLGLRGWDGEDYSVFYVDKILNHNKYWTQRYDK